MKAERRIKGRAGVVWMEVLAAMAVAGLVGLAGMRTMGMLLEQHGTYVRREVVEVSLGALEQAFRRAWDQRADAIGSAEPWLVIRGRDLSDGLELESLLLRYIGTGGRVEGWRLERGQKGWRASGGSSGQGVETRRIPYPGRILLDTPAGEWLPGAGPEAIHWRFPDAPARRLQDGFAIRRLW